jgi:hypothetical protein
LVRQWPTQQMRTEHHQLEVVRHGTTTYGPATAANVYSGPYPTWHSAPYIPHDDSWPTS